MRLMRKIHPQGNRANKMQSVNVLHLIHPLFEVNLYKVAGYLRLATTRFAPQTLLCGWQAVDQITEIYKCVVFIYIISTSAEENNCPFSPEKL